MDNNVLACEHGLEQIADMGGQDVRVDFNQGLDARLITPEIAGMLARLKWIRFIRMSCDTDAVLGEVETAIRRLDEAGVKPYRVFVYLLVQDIACLLYTSGKHRRKKQRCFPKLSSICFNPRFGGVHQAEGATNDHLLGGR